MIKPFERLNDFAQRVAEGNLDMPLTMDKGHVFGAFTESFDLMRSELKKARIAEKKASDDKKEMVAKLSHDIKTPVASIKSTSEIGFEVTKEERTKEMFNVINVKTDQIKSLVDNLFNSSIGDVTEIAVNPGNYESGDILSLIKNSDYLNRAGSFNIPGCTVYMDKLRLQQVFDNIFMNSYKYADTDIRVDSEIAEEYLIIRISDEGPGVKDEEVPLLKEKYKRGSNSSDKDGAGLGLYLTNYFMEKMDGKLTLRNLEKGFEVAVYLRII
jgi:signal transduction histidine kinase